MLGGTVRAGYHQLRSDLLAEFKLNKYKNSTYYRLDVDSRETVGDKATKA